MRRDRNSTMRQYRHQHATHVPSSSKLCAQCTCGARRRIAVFAVGRAVDYVAIGEVKCSRRLGAVQGAPQITRFVARALSASKNVRLAPPN